METSHFWINMDLPHGTQVFLEEIGSALAVQMKDHDPGF